MEPLLKIDGYTFIGRFVTSLMKRGLEKQIPDYLNNLCDKGSLQDLPTVIRVTNDYLRRLHIESGKKIKG